MQVSLKSASIALFSVLASVVAFNATAHADSPIGCKEQFIKDFTVVPYFINNTSKTIPAGTKIVWKTYWAGKQTGGLRSTVLSSDLAPNKTYSTGVQFSGDNNSCQAYLPIKSPVPIKLP